MKTALLLRQWTLYKQIICSTYQSSHPCRYCQCSLPPGCHRLSPLMIGSIVLSDICRTAMYSKFTIASIADMQNTSQLPNTRMPVDSCSASYSSLVLDQLCSFWRIPYLVALRFQQITYLVRAFPVASRTRLVALLH